MKAVSCIEDHFVHRVPQKLDGIGDPLRWTVDHEVTKQCLTLQEGGTKVRSGVQLVQLSEKLAASAWEQVSQTGCFFFDGYFRHVAEYKACGNIKD
jgi:hypothetical protein